jgi:hypothetical protein
MGGNVVAQLPRPGAALQGLGTKLQGVKTAATGLKTSAASAATTMAAQLQTRIAALGQGLTTVGNEFQSRYDVAYDQAESLLLGFESDYCSPAELIPSMKIPATFVGPSFALTFDSGNCFFNDTALLFDKVKEVVCTEPSISYAKTPATFTSKYKSAPAFVSKSCLIEKTFGEPDVRVLYVFDGASYPDMNELTAKVTQEVTQMMGTLTGGMGANQMTSQLTSMLGALPSLPVTAAAPPKPEVATLAAPQVATNLQEQLAALMQKP